MVQHSYSLHLGSYAPMAPMNLVEQIRARRAGPAGTRDLLDLLLSHDLERVRLPGPAVLHQLDAGERPHPQRRDLRCHSASEARLMRSAARGAARRVQPAGTARVPPATARYGRVGHACSECLWVGGTNGA